MALLEVRGLEKWYARRKVVNGVEFEVNSGEVVGLLGPNGAGKTTSFRMTIGLIDADGGQVVFDGRDVTKMPMYQRARSGMGYLAQDSSVFKQLSVEDNLMAILQTRRDLTRRQRKERQDDLLDQFGLTKIRATKANRVSGGERRRLEIARSLITEPKLIMLDEPFAGIDPKTVLEIQDQIRNLVTVYNIGILLTDHQFRETVQVSDRIYVIREGRVFAYGNREQIVNNPDVRRYYIGERYDVGHLLDDHAPHALGEPMTAAGADARPEPAAVAPEQKSTEGALVHQVQRETLPAVIPAPEPAASPPEVSSESTSDSAVETVSEPPSEATPDITIDLNQPGRVDADDFDRVLGGSITFMGDYVIEEVEYQGQDDGGGAPPTDR